MLFETIFIASIFVARLLVAAMSGGEVRSANEITEREMSLKDSSIV